MVVEFSVDIAAPPQRVWEVMRDVERWPEWASSMINVSLLNGTELAMGSKGRIQQPRLPVMVWEVTEIDPGRGFVWQTNSMGATTRAEHWITARDGESQVDLRVQINRLLELLFRPWLTKMTRRNVEIEAVGLKRRSEETVGGQRHNQ
jgi:uncharacterized membrane protein